MTRLSLIVITTLCAFVLTSSNLQAQYYGGGGDGLYGIPNYGTPNYGTPNYYAGNQGYGGVGTAYGANPGMGGYGYGGAIIIRVRVGGQLVETTPTVQTYYPGLNNTYPTYGTSQGYWGNTQQRGYAGSANLRNINSEAFMPGQLRPTMPLLRNQASNTVRQTRPSYRYRF